MMFWLLYFCISVVALTPVAPADYSLANVASLPQVSDRGIWGALLPPTGYKKLLGLGL